ncbi:MAG: phosphoenolpyruvate carboxykinase [Phycisphaerae bacterium]|nr:phosphoenolpyruvate carboxykinase [Phycisphaerae bacterium]
MEMSDLVCRYGLEHAGLTNLGSIYWNRSTPALYESAIRQGEAQIGHLGPLVVRMGQHTGRSANDKYVVDDPQTGKDIWWGKINVKFAQDRFDNLHKRMCSYLRGKKVFVQDCFAGADERYRLPVRIITEFAWHSLFARNMFIQPEQDAEKIRGFMPEFTVIQCPNFHADPDVDKTRSGTFVALSFTRKMILIGGTAYAGEIKKSVFTLLNYILPAKGVLPMHCSANVAKDDPEDVAIFFGLSGTGKTTLSADPNRLLIGDDEHAWSDNGVFNFEGGCYAKVINLSKDAEPEIFACTRRFGTILENVGMDPACRRVDLTDSTFTENTRASYPLTHIPNIVTSGKAGHPRAVIMLTADAFGVLPPIAKLTPEQAMYHFISGYTAKVAGTEAGVKEPTATFSACFGAPFLPRHPAAYAELLAKKLRQHDTDCWLVNTGWTGGPYGTGSRMKIEVTRTLINAALNGSLVSAPMEPDALFGFMVPKKVAGITGNVLNPRSTWKDAKAYDEQAKKLAGMFQKNFEQYKDGVSREVAEAGPRTAPMQAVGV